MQISDSRYKSYKILLYLHINIKLKNNLKIIPKKLYNTIDRCQSTSIDVDL